MGFKGRALLPRRLLKDPELLLIMPSRVPETPALTHSQNLLFPPSEQEFKPETHLRLPQPEATRSRDRLSPQPPAPLSRTSAPYRGLCLVEHKCPKTRAPTSHLAWPQPLQQLPSVPAPCCARRCCQHHPTSPHTTRIHTSWDHGSTPATTPGSAAVLMSAFTFLGRQLLGKSRDGCASPASPRAVPHPYSSERAAPPAQRRALGPRGRGRGGCSHSSPRREGIKP